MKYFPSLAISAAALALAACGHKGDTPMQNAANDTVAGVSNVADAVTVSPDQGFADTAAASDAFEIATSNLALAKAKSAAVKSFAHQMVAAHTASTEKLRAAAGAASPAIVPNPTLAAGQQSTLDELGTLSDGDFDKAYAQAQVDAHQKALDALKSYAADGAVPQLRQFAGAAVPTVTAHLNMAKALKP
jgi:putative membrane protein